ncbi:MAG TPA: SCO1664 family protein [Acidimicrobiales bacterium]|nr:SCO1664 family protein [Acidimicrobiales bacterium]
MPEDERPPASPDLTSEAWLDLLREGEVELEGRMPWSSNATFLVTVSSGELAARAIYKPAKGERPLWDFPGGLCRREVAAYLASVVLGLDVVPETVLRPEAPYGEGSLQRFVDADYAEHYFSLMGEPGRHAALRRIAGFDLLVNNADRKGGHLLLDAGGRIWAIDNGLCFHPRPKLRTVMWDFAGEHLPADVVAACEAVLAGAADALAELLAPEECAAMWRRAELLLAEPVFPEPDLEDRPYPWPLV